MAALLTMQHSSSLAMSLQHGPLFQVNICQGETSASCLGMATAELLVKKKGFDQTQQAALAIIS